MEHLSLEIFDLPTRDDPTPAGSKFASLPDDTVITVNETSEIFASGNVWTHPFVLNIPANAHIFGSSGDMHGSRLHEQIDRRRARLWVEGIALYTGILVIGGEADVDADGNIDVSLESGRKTFEQMIDGAKANQVPMIGDVQIGMALWRKRWTTCKVKLTASAKYNDDVSMSGPVKHHNGQEVFDFSYDGQDEGNCVQQYPRMVFPNGSFYDYGHTKPDETEDHVNTDSPYTEDANGTPTHPYCNVALCYQRYGYDRRDQNGVVTTDYSGEPEAQRGYEYMPANRVNSAPCFYVIYWIRALMKHLGIHIDENQMMGVEDLRRLFFVNTNCAYEEPKDLKPGPNVERYGKYRWWHATFDKNGDLIPEYVNFMKNINIDESGFVGTNVRIIDKSVDTDIDLSERVAVTIREVVDWDAADKNSYLSRNRFFHKAFATSDCFPDADISETIKAIEAGFGVRFLFSEDYRRVRIVLLRNVFRSEEVQEIACDIIGETKTENGKRGFRMTYGESDDTHFYYKGFADKLPHKKELWVDTTDKHDYSHWNLDAVYANVIKKVSAFDKTCYVTPNTGNAYGFKIDKDAKRYQELHPSVFEYAGFMDAEDGDCTGEEETIDTITVGFRPAIMNDLNMEEERKGNQRQRFALFVDDAMRPRRPDLKDGKDYNNPQAVYDIDRLYGEDSPARYMTADDGIVKPGEFAIRSDTFASAENVDADLYIYLPGFGDMWIASIRFDFDGHINEGPRLYLQDNYEPNDDGVSPIEHHDWGLTLGILRGSGSDAAVKYTADDRDGEGNDTWALVPGSGATAHPDTCDSFGKIFDYTADGQDDPQDTTGRFSLKLRAEKPNPEFDPARPESASNRRYLEITDQKLRGRGLCDQFYKEYSYWTRNARIAKIEAPCELAQLQGIDKAKKVKVGDVTGFMLRRKYQVSKKTGLGTAEMEIMYI